MAEKAIDKYVISGINEIWYYLKKYKDRTDDWRADFYDADGQLICCFEGDEETMEKLKTDEGTFELVTQMVDVAIMMGVDFVL